MQEDGADISLTGLTKSHSGKHVGVARYLYGNFKISMLLVMSGLSFTSLSFCMLEFLIHSYAQWTQLVLRYSMAWNVYMIVEGEMTLEHWPAMPRLIPREPKGAKHRHKTCDPTSLGILLPRSAFAGLAYTEPLFRRSALTG